MGQRVAFTTGFRARIRTASGRSNVEKVLELAKDGLSYRLIGRNLGLSKNTVIGII